MTPPVKAVRAAAYSLALNVVMTLVKAFAGFRGNSHALIADAIESGADVFSSLMLVVALRYSSRPADKNHPYGHGRVEPLATLFIAGFLIFSLVMIGKSAIENIQAERHQVPEPFTLIVLGTIIVTKELFYRVLISRSRRLNSSALRAEAWHHRADALTSVTALLGVAASLWLGEPFATADSWAALLACLIILFNAYRLFRPALGEIMDEHLYGELEDRIRELSKQVEGVIDTEKCLIRKTGTHYHVDLHLMVNGDLTVRAGHEIAHRLKEHLRRELPEIADVLIHIEPG